MQSRRLIRSSRENSRQDSSQEVSDSNKKSNPSYRNRFVNNIKPLVLGLMFFFTFGGLTWYDWSHLNTKSSVDGDGLVFLGEYNTGKGDDTTTTTSSSEMKSTSDSTELSPSSSSPTVNPAQHRCRQTYFWGGGKSGSTSLFYILTDITSGFYSDMVKEPCFRNDGEWKSIWERQTQATDICRRVIPPSSSSDATTATTKVKDGRPTHILNGCPRHTTLAHAQKLFEYEPNATFIMLIRDPVDRLESHLNDDCRRGGRNCNNIESVARSMIGKKNNRSFYLQLSYYGDALKNLLSVVKDAKKILIVPMESLSVDTQGVVDAIMDHVGGERWYVNKTKSVHMNKRTDGNYKFIHFNNKTRKGLRKTFAKDVRLLESLVGKKFSWSAWARNKTYGENDKDVDGDHGGWLETKPRGL